MNITAAAEVFLVGFSATRSMTHPYLIRRFDGMAVMEDGPRKRGAFRTSEYIAVDCSPAKVVAACKGDATGKYAISAIYPGPGPFPEIERRFRDLGCRLMTREPMFTQRGLPAPHRTGIDVRRVREPAELVKISQAARSRQLNPSELSLPNPTMRLFAAWVDSEPVGWVRSVRCSEEATWVSNLWVNPDYRRQGIGGALMTTMLYDDRDLGFEVSVLLASHAGAMLYPQLGYERIGTLLLYKSPR
jgi:ribosomal protein S18 acetylase RimI-like enzyme